MSIRFSHYLFLVYFCFLSSLTWTFATTTEQQQQDAGGGGGAAAETQKSRHKKAVVATLDSKWPHTCLLAEISEFIVKENDALYWDFVREVVSSFDSNSYDRATDRQLYEFGVKQAAKLLPPARLDLLKLAISLRAHSPTVEMHRQMGLEYFPIDDWPANCVAFADVEGNVVCSADELENAVLSAGSHEKSAIYNGDHVFPGSQGAAVGVLLYGSLGSNSWLKFHRVLKRMAQDRRVEYVHRHFPISIEKPDWRKVRLSGYGVELAIRSTEYKAQDDSKIKANVTQGGAVVEEEEEQEEDLKGFNFKLLKKLHPNLKEQLQDFKLHLFEADEVTPLKVWELQDLSFQAGQKVIDASRNEAVSLLKDISQNFPLWARSLSKVSVNKELRDEVEYNQQTIFEDLEVSPGDSLLFINGLRVKVDNIDLYSLLDVLKKEEKLSAGFFKMGFRREYVSLLMSLDAQEETSSYAIDYRTGFPEYINDLDKDPQYRDWGNSVKLLMQPYFPGMIRPIARNLYTLIFVINPGTSEGRSMMKIAQGFYAQQVPLRIGFIFTVNPDKSITGKHDLGVALLNLYNFLKIDQADSSKALHMIVEDILTKYADLDELAADVIIDYFKKKYSDEDVDLVFGDDSDYDRGRQAGAEFLTKSGLGSAPKVLLNGVPLDDSGVTADRIEETLMPEMTAAMAKLFQAVRTGRLTDKRNVADWIMEQDNVIPKINARILDSNKGTSPFKSKFLDMTDVMEYINKVKVPNDFVKLSEPQQNQYMIESMKYLTRNDEVSLRPLTVWIVADLETKQGRLLFYNAVKQLKHTHNVRLGLVHNPRYTEKKSRDTVVTEFVQAALDLLPALQAKNFVTKLVKEDNWQALLDKTTTLDELAVHRMDVVLQDMNLKMFKKELKLFSNDYLRIHSHYSTARLGLSPGETAVVANGQLFGPFDDDETFDSGDFALLERHIISGHAKVIGDQVKVWGVDHEGGKASNLVMRVSSLVMAEPSTLRRQWVSVDNDRHREEKFSSVFVAASDKTTAAVDVVAIVDPLTRGSQKVAPLLQLVAAALNANVKLLLNCRVKLSEMPLKSFYRLVAEAEVEFSSDGRLSDHTAQARFTALPRKQLLTLNLLAPDAWMVECVDALYDLDNIKMQMVEGDVKAHHVLEYLLLEGSCQDEMTGNPPRGLQFTLGTKRRPVFVDTIVMANLGYFQLKANPGAWHLRLREGRSSQLYDITTHRNTESAFNSADVTVLLDSFAGKSIKVVVTKKKDTIDESLLSESSSDGGRQAEGDDEQQQSLWQSISSYVFSKFGSTGGEEDTTQYDAINIFSLASGHLYERFLRIMMLSVRKNTKWPVKFWLLKNYLSPYFKKLLPYLAVKYDFSYELVQYKWPRWLHQQTEKQRVMWGYKILFLDVLFPLDVKKIIFVDADQVVRADMMELMTFNLEGAPYGYTPFCDSRTEMEGFRFWKRGYWANHLGPRKYHISALYVVNLKKFRLIAAGDRLRSQYQGLSADPNSLSNLDQDLPNNMIHQVKIKSLPQDWLWCETWCDDGSKKNAKTIDLCNNPQTKEPKLESAMRIIDEWRLYDGEIRQIEQRFQRGVPVDDDDKEEEEKEPTKESHVHDEN